MPTRPEIPCTGCGAKYFSPFAERADGNTIKQCANCGLGVIENIPTDLGAFYGDQYYLDGGVSGYDDYRLASEHGGSWATHLIKLLRNNGKLLDIGCADGYLLRNVGDGFERFGIEVNPNMAEQASASGIDVIARDLFDDTIGKKYEGLFDIVTAVAVLEHLPDFGGGFEAATRFLNENGFVLFEVPLMSSKGSNEAWLKSSFEHIFYPTEKSIRLIVENRLNCHLVGAELVIKDYASTFAGFITKSAENARKLQALFDRILSDKDDILSLDEKIARLHLQLIHMAQPSDVVIEDLRLLGSDQFTLPFVARIAQLWKAGLRRENHWQEVAQSSQADLGQRAAALDAAQSDARTNSAQAARSMIFEMERASASEIKAKNATIHASASEARKVEADYRARIAYDELQAIKNSTLWRATEPVRRIGQRFPRTLRFARRTAALALWTIQLRLFENLRQIKRLRTASVEGHSTAAPCAETQTPRQTLKLLPVAGLSDGEQSPSESEIWPTDRPLVSVIIPCFNYGHLVRDAIKSIETQTFQSIEIIVVEGGSSSIESRREFVTLIESAGPGVRVLLQGEPHRAGANRNFGISRARGKYVCCLDADDRLDPTYIEKSVFLLEHYGFDVVSAGLQSFGDRTDTWQPQERPTLDILVTQNQVLTCGVFRRSLWREAGGFRDSDPATGHIHEDWLFWTRLAALGARFINLREYLFFYRRHPNTLSNSALVAPNDVQVQHVKTFNADVLTPAAFARARQRAELQIRTPRPNRNLAHPPSFSKGGARTLMLAVPYLILGGAERLLSALVAHLAALGWRVIIVTTVATDDSNGDTTEWFRQSSLEIFHLPRFLSQDRWKDFVDYLFVSRRISLLWIVGSVFFYDYLPALKASYRELQVVDLLFNTVGHTANNRRYASYISLHLVENREVRQWLIDAGESPNRIRMISSGVDLKANSPGPKDAALLAEYSVDPDAVVVGFSGRWSAEKDPLAVVEIAKRISSKLRVLFMMTGTGPMAETLHAEVRRAGFPPGRFTICGPVPDLAPYLRTFDILLLPSRLDGRPNIVMEALANGTAVVASRVGALPEMMEDGTHGYLCTPGDYDEFAQRIMALVSAPEKLAEFKRAARGFAEQQFDIQTMLYGYAVSLDALLEKQF